MYYPQEDVKLTLEYLQSTFKIVCEKPKVLKLMFLSRPSSIFGYQLKVVYCVGVYECQISTTPHLSRIISLVVKGDRQGGRAAANQHTTPCRARHPAAGGTRDVPGHRQRPRQPHLRHRDPHLSRGGGMVPQQHSGQVYYGIMRMASLKQLSTFMCLLKMTTGQDICISIL